MASTEPASAVVVRVALPGRLARVRAQFDGANMTVPAHVTILFPFVPVPVLAPEIRRELAAIAGMCEPFYVRFARVERFPTVVYLAPEPSAPFTALTSAVARRFPDFPAYGGAFDEVIPHLTIAESTGQLDRIAAAVQACLPFTRTVRALEVLVENPDGRWRTRWRIALGIRR